VSAGRTPSQTIGPFFAVSLPWPDGPRVVAEGTPGAIRIEGRVLDGIAGPVPDALVETWQRTPGRIRGFGRCATDADGRWTIVTLKPEASPRGEASGASGAGGGPPEAPHIAVSVFARGLLKRVVTRIYFDDEAAANAGDPVLASIADPAARRTLIAERVPDGYRFDIRLQGNGETVFFDV